MEKDRRGDGFQACRIIAADTQFLSREAANRIRTNCMKILVSIILLLISSVLSSAQGGLCRPRDVRFSEGQASIVLRAQLEPCHDRVYRFRAKAGQRMRITLGPEINDVVFLIQGTKYLPDRGSFVLKGIHKNGETKWDGMLPNDDVFEIWVRRPAVSNSRQKRTLPFRLSVTITD